MGYAASSMCVLFMSWRQSTKQRHNNSGQGKTVRSLNKCIKRVEKKLNEKVFHFFANEKTIQSNASNRMVMTRWKLRCFSYTYVRDWVENEMVERGLISTSGWEIDIVEKFLLLTYFSVA